MNFFNVTFFTKKNCVPMKKGNEKTEKNQKNEENENEITLLRTFEEIDQSNKAFFTVQAFPGFNLHITKEIKYGINSSTVLSLMPLHFSSIPDDNGEMRLIPSPNRAFQFGLFKPFQYGFASIMAANDGSFGFEGLINPSPFLAANSSFLTNFQEFSVSSSLCVRQPWISICSHLTTNSISIPQILALSTFAGTNLFGLGVRYLPPQSLNNEKNNKENIDKKAQFEFLLHSQLDKYKFQFSHSPSLYSARIMSNWNENWSFGLQFVKEKQIQFPHMEISWIFKQEKSMVHSIISSAGIVATDFLKNISENLDLTVCLKLDHFAGDYTCGLSLSYK